MTDAVVTGQFVEVLEVTASNLRVGDIVVSALREGDPNLQVADTFVNVLRSVIQNPLWVAAQYVEVIRGGEADLQSASIITNVLHDVDTTLDVTMMFVNVMYSTSSPSPPGGSSRQMAVTIISG